MEQQPSASDTISVEEKLKQLEQIVENQGKCLLLLNERVKELEEEQKNSLGTIRPLTNQTSNFVGGPYN